LGAKVEKQTTREFLQLWLKGKSEATELRYKSMANALLEFLGPKADRPITTVSSADIEAFKNELSNELALATVALTISLLKFAFDNCAYL
jgi:hypothetical protein